MSGASDIGSCHSHLKTKPQYILFKIYKYPPCNTDYKTICLLVSFIMSGGSFLWVILVIESLEIYVPVIICIRIDDIKCWNFLKDFLMKFGMFSLISKSQDVKILGIKRTGFPILSQQKMKNTMIC